MLFTCVNQCHLDIPIRAASARLKLYIVIHVDDSILILTIHTSALVIIAAIVVFIGSACTVYVEPCYYRSYLISLFSPYKNINVISLDLIAHPAWVHWATRWRHSALSTACQFF